MILLYILAGLIIGSLIDCCILALFEGIKRLVSWLSNEEPDDDTFTNMMIITYNITIVIIPLIVSIIMYFILN